MFLCRASHRCCRILDQVDESTHEEFSSIARALMPVARSSSSSSIESNSLSSHFPAILFTCVSDSETILEELFSAGYFTLLLSRLSRLAHRLPPSITFNLPVDRRATTNIKTINP